MAGDWTESECVCKISRALTYRQLVVNTDPAHTMRPDWLYNVIHHKHRSPSPSPSPGDWSGESGQVSPVGSLIPDTVRLRVHPHPQHHQHSGEEWGVDVNLSLTIREIFWSEIWPSCHITSSQVSVSVIVPGCDRYVGGVGCLEGKYSSESLAPNFLLNPSS